LFPFNGLTGSVVRTPGIIGDIFIGGGIINGGGGIIGFIGNGKLGSLA